MMEAVHPARIPLRPRGVLPLDHLALLCVLSLAAVAWGALLIAGQEGHDLERYSIVLGVYAFAAIYCKPPYA